MKRKVLTLGFSPCPNDTFIFDALVNRRIDTEGLEFDYFISDVEELNKKAFSNTVDITKISCHAYAYAAENYLIVDSGSALGYGNGPLLISNNFTGTEKIESSLIAIPGKYTTANLLFSIAWPEAKNKNEYVFSYIEEAILKGEVDFGLIIHETRFTYQKKGLRKIADMGEFWENLTGLPVPLGSIVVNRRLPQDIAVKFNRLLRRSIEYASENPESSLNFVSSNAREIEESVIKSHINLYVNDFTCHLGDKGRKAITELFRIGGEKGVIPRIPEEIFLEDK